MIFTLAAFALGLLAGAVLLFLFVSSAKTAPRQKPIKSKWRLQVNGNEILVRTGDRATPYSWQISERWRFNPADLDSRAKALAQAEDYLDGLRDVEQRAQEINGR